MFRSFDISPNPTLIKLLPSDQWEQMTVELTVRALEQFCQERFDTDDLKYLVAYHFALDRHGNPHPHTHVVTEGSIDSTKRGERVPFTIYPKQLEMLKDTFAAEFTQQLDKEVGRDVWEPVYAQWQRDQDPEQIAAMEMLFDPSHEQNTDSTAASATNTQSVIDEIEIASVPFELDLPQQDTTLSFSATEIAVHAELLPNIQLSEEARNTHRSGGGCRN